MKQNWISIEKKQPKDGQRCIIAILNKYSNARWDYTITTGDFIYDIGFKPRFISSSYHSLKWPKFWMPFPETPELSDEEKVESEKCHMSEKMEKLNRAKEKVRILEESMKQ